MPKPLLPVWILSVPLFMCLHGCESVVPPDADFLSEHDPSEAACEVLVAGEGGGVPLTVGAVLPMTREGGKPDARGTHRSQAMRLAFEEMNQRSGVDDRPFRLIVCDTRAGWVAGGGDAARELAAWLAQERDARAILCGGSADTLAMEAVTRKLDVLLMSVSGTSIEITDLADDGLVWRVAPSDRHQGIVLADLAQKTLASGGGDAVAIVAVGNPYGDGLVKVIGDHLMGVKASVYTLDVNGSNLEKELQRVADDDPDVLLIITPSTMAAAVVNGLAAHASLAKVDLLLSDSAHNPDFLQDVQDLGRLKTARGTLPGAPVSPALDTFVSRYKSRFGDDPTQQSFTAHSYDASYCLGLAHAWALGTAGGGKVTGSALSEGLSQLSDTLAGETYTLQPTEFSPMRKSLLQGKPIDIEGASGALDFDPATGEAPSAVEIWRVDAGPVFAAVKWVKVVEGAGAPVVKELSP